MLKLLKEGADAYYFVNKNERLNYNALVCPKFEAGVPVGVF